MARILAKSGAAKKFVNNQRQVTWNPLPRAGMRTAIAHVNTYRVHVPPMFLLHRAARDCAHGHGAASRSAGGPRRGSQTQFHRTKLMRVLFSTVSRADYMAPPRLSSEQVNCGPEWPERSEHGRIVSLNTPPGEYDLAAIAAKLPAPQQPELVVCLVDASWRNLPRNLGAFTCPKILLIADTHHMGSPLLGMFRYVVAESFDRLIFLYDRHHAAFFMAAGLPNVHWLPGLTFPWRDAQLTGKNAIAQARISRIGMVGQAGKYHPRRKRLLEAMVAARLPVVAAPIPQTEALNFYRSSLIGFNASLNGDFNLRVLEILASGALLLTDRLSSSAGLTALFAEGQELVTYGSEDELLERVRYFLDRPAEARAIGERGRGRFLELFSEGRRAATWQALMAHGEDAPEFAFSAAERSQVFFGGGDAGTDHLIRALTVYEGVQEMHRQLEKVTLAVDETVSPDATAIFATLPRLTINSVPDAHLENAADFVIFGKQNVANVATGPTEKLWCWDAVDSDLAELRERLGQTGFVPASDDLAVFCYEPPEHGEGAAELAEATASLQRGEQARAFQLAKLALQKAPHSVPAMILLGDVALKAQQPAMAESMYRAALSAKPNDENLTHKINLALVWQKKDLEGSGPAQARALLTFAREQEKCRNRTAAVALLEQVEALAPTEAESQLQLGSLFKRCGAIPRANRWHRLSMGLTESRETFAPADRPVRVAFLAQHPQGWTSLESVWRTLANDPAFEVSVIAAPYLHPYPPEGGTEAIYGFLQKAGVAFTRWDARPLKRGFADIIFVQNPYDVTRPPALCTAALWKLVPRLAYVPYGLEIGGGQTNAGYQFDLPLQRHAWAIFARSNRHRAMFERHCSAGAEHVHVTGHPRLDILQDLECAPPDAEFVEIAHGRKIVFWNPQFDIRPAGDGFSTFLIWQEFFLREFARRQDLAFVIRPHPLFFGTLQARKLWTTAQVDDFLARVAAAGNVLIDRRASYLPVFAASSAMLSDASTFLLEYAATGKPLLYLRNPNGPQLNEDGSFVEQHCGTAPNEAAVQSFLDDVAAGRDPNQAVRMAAYGEIMHQPAGGIGQAIKAVILEQLAREHRAGASGEGGSANAVESVAFAHV